MPRIGRKRRLAGACLAVLPLVSCGSGNHATKTAAGSHALAAPQAEMSLKGSGFDDVRIGTSAQQAQHRAEEILGPPEHQRFSGCELGGPTFVYRERAWTWGALTLTFSNRATTPRVSPGRFTSWIVGPTGTLPRSVRLPAGLNLGSSPDDVRSAVPLRSAGEGLPGTYDLVAADGVTYSFTTPFRKLSSASVDEADCE